MLSGKNNNPFLNCLLHNRWFKLQPFWKSPIFIGEAALQTGGFIYCVVSMAERGFLDVYHKFHILASNVENRMNMDMSNHNTSIGLHVHTHHQEWNGWKFGMNTEILNQVLTAYVLFHCVLIGTDPCMVSLICWPFANAYQFSDFTICGCCMMAMLADPNTGKEWLGFLVSKENEHT